MASVDEYLEQIYPKLYLMPSTTKDIYQDMAEKQTSVDFFGSSYELALALRMSHYYFIDTDPSRQGHGGAVTGKTEGRVSISMWNSNAVGDYSTLNQTSYGQRLKALMKSISGAVSSNGMY